MQTDLFHDEHLAEIGQIPEGNRPGHHPEHDQDKPDLDAFRARMANPAGAQTPEDEDHGVLGTIGLATLGLGSIAITSARRVLSL
jgi:hypothetical protein